MKLPFATWSRVTPVALLLVVVLWWLVYRAAFWLLGVAVLLGCTYWLTRPELRMLRGRGDGRPWLVRIREHRWRPVAAPLVGSLPRPTAYLLLLLAWWWITS